MLRLIFSTTHIEPGTGTQVRNSIGWCQRVGGFLRTLDLYLRLTLSYICIQWGRTLVVSSVNGEIFGPSFLALIFFLFSSSTSLHLCPAPFLIYLPCSYMYYPGSYIEDLAFWFDINPITLQLPLPLAIPGNE